jgi:hypothetical protein
MCEIILKKDLINCSAGRVFKQDVSGNYFHSMTDAEAMSGMFKMYKFTKEEVESHSSWFDLGETPLAIKTVIINGETYKVKKAKFDFTNLDCDGYYHEYMNKSYVIIEEGEEGFVDDPRVRMIDCIQDRSTDEGEFDADNFNEDYIAFVLSHGDESFPDFTYEIISTTNTTGEVLYDHLVHYNNDEFKNGVTIHNDLKTA